MKRTQWIRVLSFRRQRDEGTSIRNFFVSNPMSRATGTSFESVGTIRPPPIDRLLGIVAAYATDWSLR